MNNFSDGKTDGLALFYVKDGNVYPVGIKKDDLELLDVMIPTIIKTAYPDLKTKIGTIEVVNRCGKDNV